jgi:hypothetical protein
MHAMRQLRYWQRKKVTHQLARITANAALDATGARVAMIAANAGHSGLSDLEEAWIVRSLCREHEIDQASNGRTP